ncbi:hypothetical protein SAMN05421767_11724 [Granulicatella balaenopterae]|uniref:Uncharacterized protein n=1 Tax=Granulicatella balaenopterae TaxID=137733 RepID=A0A1H9L5P9_9LACT|nr:hypothetical protein [Granulicatella balaenopterae]SER06477.1 hypothetical protein SAMN05421767_11724 [Granulicatella balaenopterae]
MDSMLSILIDFDMCLKSLSEIESSNTVLIDYVDKDLGFTPSNLGTLSASQIIDKLLSLPGYISPYFYLMEQSNELSEDVRKCLNHTRLLILKNQYAKRHFNTSYYTHYKLLDNEWQKALHSRLSPTFYKNLDQQREFLYDVYGSYFASHSLNHFHILSHLYGQEFVEYHTYCLNRFKANYSSFMKRTQLEKDLKFKSHLFVGMNQEKRKILYQTLINNVFNKHFDCQVTVHFHKHSHIITKHHENTYVISLANYLTFAEELDQLLTYLGEIFYKLSLKRTEESIDACCTNNYAKEQMIAFFQFLPLACPSVATFITKTALELEQIPLSKKKMSFYQEELLMYYISFHSNPLRRQLVNPLQRINLLYCEANIEKLWFNKAISSAELPDYWEEITLKTFKKAPSHPIEGTLRMVEWKDINQGHAFIKLVAICNLFHDELTPDGEVPIFKEFSKYFDNNSLHLWNSQQIINKDISDQVNPAQNALNFIGQFYNNYIYRRPLLVDKY